MSLVTHVSLVAFIVVALVCWVGWMLSEDER